MWSEAAPPAPLRGHFNFFTRDHGPSRPDDDDGSARIENHDIPLIGRGDEAALITTKPPRFYESPGAQIERVPVHGADDAGPPAHALGQTCTGMVASVLDRTRDSIDHCDEDVKRRVLQPDEAEIPEASARHPSDVPQPAHRPIPSAA